MKVIILAIVNASIGGALTYVAFDWWPAWLILAAYLIFLIGVAVVMPYWAFRLLGPRRSAKR